jgi:hypothetical protein
LVPLRWRAIAASCTAFKSMQFGSRSNFKSHFLRLMDQPPKTYTAGQLAGKLGWSRSAVHRRLAGVSPDKQNRVGGQKANFWSVARLPEALREPLTEAFQDSGCRNIDDFLADRSAKWQPAIPWVECAERYQERARKLKEALATALERRNDAALLPGELAKVGQVDYQRVFGHSISLRWWYDLFNRTLERAGTEADFSRLDLYLDEHPARGVVPQRPEVKEDGLFELRLALNQLRDPGALSEDLQRHVLATAIERYDALIDVGEPPRTVKTEIFNLLISAGVKLAANRDALRKQFDRAYQRWVAGGRNSVALKDGRKTAAKGRRQPIPQEDQDIIMAITVMECGGRLSQGWRRCLERGALSEQFLGRFLTNPASKSHVPNVVRRVIGPRIPMLMEQHHGERGARDNGAYVNRYWENVPSLAWYCADDATLGIYFHVPDDKGWFTLMRGQFLVVIDTRSTCILGYALMPERSYNARVIRTLITRVCDQHGLPRRGFLFERGIWESSRILKGATGNDVPLEWQEVERGLTEFGLVFKHAIRARSKPVERVIGALQNLADGEPGYAGRDEMKAGFESFKRLKLQVDSRKLDPRGKFYSQEQWDQRLGQLCQKYNAERQQGKMTMGLSPEEALQRFQDPSDKGVRFDERCRYLFANYRRPVRVTANGITLFKDFNYRNERTGQLRGQTVIAWFDPEAPEVLTVTDMNRENPFCVERSAPVPALDASDEIMAQEMRRVENHLAYSKTTYRVIKAKYQQEFRPNLVSQEVVELGRQIEAQRGAIVERRQLRARTRRACGASANVVPADGRPEQFEAMEELNRLLKKEGTQ